MANPDNLSSADPIPTSDHVPISDPISDSLHVSDPIPSPATLFISEPLSTSDPLPSSDIQSEAIELDVKEGEITDDIKGKRKTDVVTDESNYAGAADNNNSDNNSVGGGDLPGAVNVLRFHFMERRLFMRLTRYLKKGVNESKAMIALWLWAEAVGHSGFLRHVCSSSDAMLLKFCQEAKLCLEVLMGLRVMALVRNCSSVELPMTSWLIEEPIDLRFFFVHRKTVMDGVAAIHHRICQLIFDDDIMINISEATTHPENRRIMSSGLIISRPLGENAEKRKNENEGDPMEVDPGEAPPPRGNKKAKQNGEEPKEVAAAAAVAGKEARPLAPPGAVEPLVTRSVFLTFNMGLPVSGKNVAQFFNMRYGKCVERVDIERHVPEYLLLASSSSVRELYGPHLQASTEEALGDMGEMSVDELAAAIVAIKMENR
ncbi:unnamed protein product [Spirodela intermedia]|uniref:Uncharacterized protein n=1 Tax=Spirodela intermedia TaxID=51605 RepID=A0A7I8IGK4_SPIIN|nr:unnamed protein product [Spirodela intermedia]CAA6656424.1 unnamed protein product [Spirodela intermedia]